MSRIGLAFRAFFSILGGSLPEEIASVFGYSKAPLSTPRRSEEPPQAQTAQPSDGALQLLGILQRDARLLDFLLEDIASYSDEQVGAAARNVHSGCQDALKKHVRFGPVIDGVEGTFVKPESAGQLGKDPAAIRFVGNLPAKGKPAGGTLRHRGWRADSISLPALNPKQNLTILAPAELEVE
ncbi:MAG: DUF2760 domain-containing protein [Bryobacteraceae bacterium]